MSSDAGSTSRVLPPVAQRREDKRERRGTRAPRSRTLLVHSSDSHYGSDRVALAIAESLAAVSDVEVWLPEDAATDTADLSKALAARGIPVGFRRLPILRRRNLTPGGLRRLLGDATHARHAIRGANFDLVYLATSACLPLAPAARSVGVPRVLLHVQEQWSGIERPVLAMLAGWCTRVVGISRVALRTAGIDPDGGAPGRALLIPNGVEPARSPARANRADEAARERAMGPRAPRYLVASRWSPGKGHATLLRAWEAAGCPGVLTILGGPPPLGAGVDVPALVEELVSSPSTVRVVGEVDDVASYIAEADALILPSDGTEGLGLVLIEAASAGKPSIASRSGGPEEVILDGETGWLYPTGDSAALASLLRSLDPTGLARAGGRARQRFDDTFSMKLFRRRMAALLREELPPPVLHSVSAVRTGASDAVTTTAVSR